MTRCKGLALRRAMSGLRRRLSRFGMSIYRKTFPLWQRLGFHITINHYYWPIPDTRYLDDKLWQQHSDMVGVNMDEEEQLKLLGDVIERFREEYSAFPLHKSQISEPFEYYINNGYFGSVDGETLYSIIRYFKPARILEIGAGNSTYLCAHAACKNRKEGFECEVTSFEPYPNDVLKDGFPGLTRLVPIRAQEIPLAEFTALKENDILFIDSSHVLKIGSDVHYEYLEVLPRLNKGVIIHLHDIFLPAEYPRKSVLNDYMFWSEQYLLHAFLLFNDHFEVLWAGSYMHLKHPVKLEAAFNSYSREMTWPGSFWIRKTK